MTRNNELPTGTVTFFFSDVQDSTGLLQRLAAGYKDVLERHAAIVRSCLSEHGGVEVSTEGDSFFAVFPQAADAVAAASVIQQRLAAESWPVGGTVAVRIGLHAGTAELGLDNYIGIDVNRAARIGAAGHGGQVVVSDSVRALASAADYSDLGTHALKGLDRAEHLYQLDIAGLPQTFPPLRTQSTRPNNLPALASRILGRDAEEAQLQELLATNRLVTITGPGGIGKTRLALEVANDVLVRFERGAFFVDMAPIDDPELMLPAIASAVGVEQSSNGDLAAALADGERLLVLDNLEQLVAAAPLVANLMAQAAPLKVLATSQVPLRISGETVLRLAPLAATDAMSPAVELFVARAAQADSSFDLETYREDVLRLVDLLDGIPLAIELAAARVNVLTPAQVLERLDSGVLKTSRADTPERHRSIAAAVEWSYGLLTASQQELLQVLTVFRGGATLTAIESVIERDPLDDLAELVDRSLLLTEAATGGKRFDMLMSVQLFASDQLEDAASAAARHSDYFFQLAMDAHQPLEGDARARWLAVLADDHDNLRATLDRLLDAGDLERGYDMLGSIWRFFHSTGRLDELDLWFGRFFTADAAAEPTLARARALVARAAMHYWRSGYPKAAADYEAALAIVEAHDDRHLLVEVLTGLTSTRAAAMATGDGVGDPTESGERAHALAVQLDDPARMALAEFGQIVMTSILAPEPVLPDRGFFERMIGLYEQAGQLMNVAHTQVMLSEVEIANGSYEEARHWVLEGLDTAERAGDTFTMAWALHRFAITAVELGDPIVGSRIDGASWAARKRTGGTLPPPFFPIGEAIDRARAVIGDEADAAFEDGKELGLFEAVALARESAGDGTRE
jgi:predicted ATPase/class 3 adenylate cyclase